MFYLLYSHSFYYGHNGEGVAGISLFHCISPSYMCTQMNIMRHEPMMQVFSPTLTPSMHAY